MINIPQVSVIPQVSSDTAQITVRYLPIPMMGMVWEILACGIPVTIPNFLELVTFYIISENTN